MTTTRTAHNGDSHYNPPYAQPSQPMTSIICNPNSASNHNVQSKNLAASASAPPSLAATQSSRRVGVSTGGVTSNAERSTSSCNEVVGNGKDVADGGTGVCPLQAYPALGSILVGANAVAQQAQAQLSQQQQDEMLRQLTLQHQQQQQAVQQQHLIQQLVQQQQQLAQEQQLQQAQNQLLQEMVGAVNSSNATSSVSSDFSNLILHLMTNQQEHYQRQQQLMELIQRVLPQQVQAELQSSSSNLVSSNPNAKAPSRLELLQRLSAPAALQIATASVDNNAKHSDAGADMAPTATLEKKDDTTNVKVSDNIGDGDSPGGSKTICRTTTLVPCRARGQPREHNHKVCMHVCQDSALILVLLNRTNIDHAIALLSFCFRVVWSRLHILLSHQIQNMVKDLFVPFPHARIRESNSSTVDSVDYQPLDVISRSVMAILIN